MLLSGLVCGSRWGLVVQAQYLLLGVVGGVARREDAGLIYFDGDADLSLPVTSGSGVLDTMGMTHLLGDGVPALSRSGPRFPLLRPGQVELFGFDPGELDTGEWARLTGLGLHATPAPAVREDPAGRAAVALSRLEHEAGAVVVHFDVDVLDTGAFPLANFPHFAGLTFEEAAACLGISLATAKRRWTVARAWLFDALSDAANQAAE